MKASSILVLATLYSVVAGGFATSCRLWYMTYSGKFNPLALSNLTINNFFTYGIVMTADCLNKAGEWGVTALDLNYCLWNDNGVLKGGNK